eukprot:TRINITY_DN327_c0_g2_i1.p1 TRINITY_DN327_c0_g2~~TRINITY_DN327_c0_g2_i1.p1  ORF type:complete len:825 (+),score=204.24 TRINITY_DN327_c0_g2_i1:90-2564(+)
MSSLKATAIILLFLAVTYADIQNFYSPASDQEIVIGSEFRLYFTTDGTSDVESVEIYYSSSTVAVWNIGELPQDGSETSWDFMFTITEPLTAVYDYYRLRVNFVDGTSDTSGHDFKLVRAEAEVFLNDMEDMFMGDEATITWSTAGDISTVDIEFYFGNDFVYSIAHNISADVNSFTFTVPKLPNGDTLKKYYKLRIYLNIYDIYADHSEDQYDELNIGVSYADASITVTKPNQGEYEKGIVMDITWNYEGDFDNVSIYYVLSNIEHLIVEGTPNTGLYQWELPSDLAIASNYRIRVKSLGISSIYLKEEEDDSIYWDLVGAEGSITFTTPAKNDEEWHQRKTYGIKWASQGQIDTVGIELLSYPSKAQILLIHRNETYGEPNEKAFFWTVPSHLSENYYYLYIYPIVYGSQYDFEDLTSTQRIKIVPPQTSDEVEDEIVADYDPVCAQLQCGEELTGDAFCACMRNCGRRCLPGYKWLFYGYDFVTDETKGPVVNAQFDRENIWADDGGTATGEEFFQPQATNVVLENRQSLESNNYVYDNVREWAESKTVGIEAVIPVSGVGISGSGEYSQSQSTFESKQVRMGETVFDSPLYTLSHTTSSAAALVISEEFKFEIDNLPETYDATKYRASLDLYGTFYFQSVMVGVRVDARYFIEECIFNSDESEGVAATVGLASEQVPGAEAQGSYSQEETESLQCLEYNSESSIHLYGGKIQSLGCSSSENGVGFECSGDLNEFAKTKTTNPYRFEGYMGAVYEIVAEYDPVKGEHYKTATEAYLQEAEDNLVEPEEPSKTFEDCVCGPEESVSAFLVAQLVLVVGLILL